MVAKKTKIIANRNVCAKYFKLTIDSAQVARLALPGQFVNIKVSRDSEPFLRRPFSIHRIRSQPAPAKRSGPGNSENRSQIEILYEVVGKATEILSKKKSGEYLDIIGPLGNGFSLNAKRSTLNAILVAGGMGVAPLIFLAEKLAEIQNAESKIQNLVLIGAKTKNLILCEKEFKQFGFDVKIATDDGSAGFKGYVSELLRKELHAIRYPLNATIYACGPKPMLKEVALISKKYKIPAQISLEEHMACGIGACFGCAVNTKQGFKRVCKDGPVFNADEIIF